MLAHSRPLVLLCLLAIQLQSAHSQHSDGTEAGAVFVYPTDAGPDFVVALTVANSSDLMFHLSGPSEYSWIAFGIGEDMDDSLMFILYEGDDDKSSTLSPRVASNGESEPSFYPAITCTPTGESKRGTSSDVIMSVNAICRNATTWDGGSLDLTSSSHPFMFAFGPAHELRSDSLSAGLIRHQLYGNFDIDITKAASDGSPGLPQPSGSNNNYVRLNSSAADGVTSDGDTLGLTHGVIMCVAYIFLYPLGALLLRLMKTMPVRIHMICQVVASVLVIVGFGLGVAASKQYNRSRDYTDPHQIIGIILLAAVVVQLTLGEVHHLIFKRKNKATVLGKIHLVVGPLIIVLAMVNGGLGLRLALSDSGPIIAYSVIIAVLFIALVGVRAWIGKKKSKDGKALRDPETDDSIPLGFHQHGRRPV